MTDIESTTDAALDSLVQGLSKAPRIDLTDNGFDAAAIIATPSENGLKRRIEDLAVQIDFLESEVVRYRTALENERLRHAQQLADSGLELDRRSDILRRSEREHTAKLHESYRKLLAERQIELEEAISHAAAGHALELQAERERHTEIVVELRRRAHRQLEAGQAQTIDELNAGFKTERDELIRDLEQARSTISRLTEQIEVVRAEAAAAKAAHKDQTLLVATLERRLDVVDGQHRAQTEDLQRQVAIAEARIQAERQRAAATVAEVLEHSASIAAEADIVRTESASLIARAEDAAANARRQARFEYEVLAEEADERAYRASIREAELEATIARLRAER